MRTNTFEDEFRERYESIVSRGNKIGFTVTHICRETSIARATPERWRKRTPKTILLIDQMDKAVTKAEKAYALAEISRKAARDSVLAM